MANVMAARAYLMRVRSGKLKEYIAVHKTTNVWPDVVQGLAQAGIARQIIFQHGHEIILFEEAQDFETSYSYLAKHPATRDWDEMIDGYMETYPQFDAELGDIKTTRVPILFYFDNGTLRDF